MAIRLSSVNDIPSATPASAKALAEGFSYVHLEACKTFSHPQWVLSTCSRLSSEFHDLPARQVRKMLGRFTMASSSFESGPRLR